MIERFEHADVEGIRVGRFPGQISTTCIVYRLGGTVIDTGPPNQWSSVRRFLEEHQVEQVLVTHHHEDHSGNLARLEHTLAPRLYCPRRAVEPLCRGFPLRLYQHVIWGRPGRVRPDPLPPAVEIGGGRTLRPLATPGHSTDMTCYLDAERGWLFTGDLYISGKTRYRR